MNNIGLLSEKSNKKCPQLIEDAISIIEGDYAFLYGIDDLATRLEVSKPHLIRRFTALCGISPGQYLTYIRLEKAKSILKAREVPALDFVAAACGYANANYFSKAFRKYTGLAPMAYAKKAQGEALPSDLQDIIQKMYL